MVIGARILFITEETEKAMYSVSNSISGIIMVIMIISFRTKTTTDYSDHADNKRKFLCEFSSSA